MLVGGYDPAQVRAAIDERDERLLRLEREAKRLAEGLIEAEQRLQRTLTPVGPEGGPAGAISGLGRRLEEIHQQARGQATRIRMKALEDAVQISDRVVELTRLRDELSARVSELAGRAGIGPGVEAGPPAVATEPSSAGAEGVYSGRVEVEIGPLKDFAQLSDFEDAAAGIDEDAEIKVTRFSDGRAAFSMNFAEPVELLRELEERAPFEFHVRDTRDDGVILDVDDSDEPRHAA